MSQIPSPTKTKRNTLLLGSGIIILALLLLAFAVLFLPLRAITPLSEYPHYTYSEALAAISIFDQAEQDALDDRCHSRIYHHEAPTAQVVLLLHGYTNCPQQFDALGQQLYQAGYTVVIPRMPGHGHQDNLPEALGDISMEDYLFHVHHAISVAAPLGEHLTVMGLSVGGTLTMWASLYDDRPHHFVTIAPVTYPTSIPPYLRNAVVRYAALTPNRFQWWDKEAKNHRIAPPYAYHRYATKSLAIPMHINAHLEQALTKGQGTGRPITFVINHNDQAISTPKLHQLADHYAHHNMRVQRTVFDQSLALPHDIIDPHNIKDLQDHVYSVLTNLLLTTTD